MRELQEQAWTMPAARRHRDPWRVCPPAVPAVVIATLTLAACAPPWIGQPTPLPKPGIPVEARARPKAPLPVEEKEAPEETIARAPATTALPTSAMLRGMTPTEIRHVLGTPTSTRESAATEVWRYAAGGCAVEVFFALDLADESRRVVALEGSPDDDGLACVARQRLAAGGR